MTDKLKLFESIGCCGINCSLCPRFHTIGNSACPGCGGLRFKDKHPSCGFLTCCAIKNGFEVCSFCNDYPCKRFDAEKSGYDSFVTHINVFSNLDFIKQNGISQFIDQQKIRTEILTDFITNYDDGRSKSFFCLSCALLPLENLNDIQRIANDFNDSSNLKDKNKRLKEILLETADGLKIDLKLRNKK
jgi:hypothetical protein